MLVRKLTFAVVVLCFAFTGSAAHAQEAGALLDLLVRKKVITDQEAEEVRSELSKEAAATSAGKWKLSTPINEIELYGDARLRYEYRGGGKGRNDPGKPNGWECGKGQSAHPPARHADGRLVFWTPIRNQHE